MLEEPEFSSSSRLFFPFFSPSLGLHGRSCGSGSYPPPASCLGLWRRHHPWKWPLNTDDKCIKTLRRRKESVLR